MCLSKQYEDELFYFAANTEDISSYLTVLYSDSDGTMHTYEQKTARTAAENKVYGYYLDFNELLGYATADESARLHAVTVRVGQRMFTYYFVDKVPDEQFLFRNAFNVFELLTVNGKTTRKFSSQRSEAMCDGVSQFYDLRNELAYEFESVRLSTETAESFMQLFISPHIRKGWANEDMVVVKDLNYEIANDDEDKRTVKFTWKYADNRLQSEKTFTLNGKMFTREYNDKYK